MLKKVRAVALSVAVCLGVNVQPLHDRPTKVSREEIPPEKLFDDPLWGLRKTIQNAISLGMRVRCIDGESVIPFSDGYLSSSLDVTSAQNLFQIREYEMASNILNLVEEFGKVAVFIGRAHTLDSPSVKVRFRRYNEPLELVPVFQLSKSLGRKNLIVIEGIVVEETEDVRVVSLSVHKDSRGIKYLVVNGNSLYPANDSSRGLMDAVEKNDTVNALKFFFPHLI